MYINFDAKNICGFGNFVPRRLITIKNMKFPIVNTGFVDERNFSR